MSAKTAAIAITVACTATIAGADTVDVKFLGTGRGTNAKVKLDGNQKHVFVGQLKHRFSNGTGLGAEIDGDFITYCSDLTQYVSSSTKTFTVEEIKDLPNSPGQTPMGADAAQAIMDIYKAAGGSQLLSGTDKALATAFQLAVWEIVYDFDGVEGVASLDTASGAFRIVDLANAYESSINAHLTALFGSVGNNGTGEGLFGVASGNAQDQLVVVPLPAGAMLGFAGLGGVALARRRFTRA